MSDQDPTPSTDEDDDTEGNRYHGVTKPAEGADQNDDTEGNRYHGITKPAEGADDTEGNVYRQDKDEDRRPS